jgi:uncharacterized protein YybS (DUF2232 family)
MRLSSAQTAASIAVTVAMGAAVMYLPLVGFMFVPLVPLPSLVSRLRLGPKEGWLVPVVSGLAMALLVGRISADLSVFIALLLTGWLMGALIERRHALDRVVMVACGLDLALAAAGLLLTSQLAGKGVLELLTEYVGRNLAMTLELYRDTGISGESLRVINDSLDRIQYVLVRLLPGLTAAGALVLNWGVLVLSRPLLRAQGLPQPSPDTTLSLWRAPEALVWPAIASGVLLLLPALDLKILGLNGLLVLGTVYFFQGMAIVAFFFEKKRLPRPVRALLYALLLLQQLLLLAIVGLGFFDLWFNFRKLDTRHDTPPDTTTRG